MRLSLPVFWLKHLRQIRTFAFELASSYRMEELRFCKQYVHSY